MLSLKLNLYRLLSLMMLNFSLFLFLLSMNFMLNEKIMFLNYEIMNFSSIEWSLMLFIDKYSLMFNSLVLYISGVIMLYSEYYMDSEKSFYEFILLKLLFVMSMIILIYSGNLLMILLGWDGLGLISFLLVIFYQNKSSLSGGLLTVLSNRVGDSFMILSFGLMYMYSDFMFFSMNISSESLMIMLMLLIMSMTKSAQLPFSAWLPSAMSAPTPVSALVHSSTLVTAGVYLLSRFSVLLMSTNVNELLFFISVVTMTMSSISAYFEFDYKKIVALSTLSQMSVMMMSLSVGLLSLTYFHLFVHALFKSMMFLCVGGMIYQGFGNQDMRMSGSNQIFNSISSSVMVLSLMSLSGMIFLSGYYSKDLILESYFTSDINIVMSLMLIISTFCTLMYSYRMCLYIYMNSFKGNSIVKFMEEFQLIQSLIFLSIGVLSSGVIMSWMLLPKPVIIFLSVQLKLMILMIIPISMIYQFLMMSWKLKSYKMMKGMNFFKQMWFISMISGQYSGILFMKLYSYNFKIFDKGIMELLVGKEIYKLKDSLTKKSSWSKYFKLEIYFINFLCIFLSVIIFLYI
uniref:NADH-ubiquinone oxidoreductase chain 5 n=1 Tax=Anoplodactylus australis TaxID=2992006 RepID=A0A9E7V7A1_9CHEL|nr:NADH dehydrogenase subunit 5 [Anoplodactylus australis]UZA61242.1 NADH dehydrogenase subunit 5 [Anoplodactylus australis]